MGRPAGHRGGGAVCCRRGRQCRAFFLRPQGSLSSRRGLQLALFNHLGLGGHPAAEPDQVDSDRAHRPVDRRGRCSPGLRSQRLRQRQFVLQRLRNPLCRIHLRLQRTFPGGLALLSAPFCPGAGRVRTLPPPAAETKKQPLPPLPPWPQKFTPRGGGGHGPPPLLISSYHLFRKNRLRSLRRQGAENGAV